MIIELLAILGVGLTLMVFYYLLQYILFYKIIDKLTEDYED